MHFTITVDAETYKGEKSSGDAFIHAPEGRINIYLAEPQLDITFDAKPLINAIKNSLLDELGLL